MRGVRFNVPSDDEEEEQALPGQFLQAFPNDLVARKVLPFLDLPDLRRLPLASKSWSALLSKGSFWSSVVCKEWFMSNHWLVMLCRTANPAEMEFAAFPVARKNLPTSSGSSSALSEDCWVSLSSAMLNCIRRLVRVDDASPLPPPPPLSSMTKVTMFPLDDRCLISATTGLICIIWHRDLRRRPLRSHSPVEPLYVPTTFNTAMFSPLLIDILNGTTTVLAFPNQYLAFYPVHIRSGRQRRNVFLSMQRDNHPGSHLTMILHDDLLNFVEVYSSHTGSWRGVVARWKCAVDDYPPLKKFTTSRVHLGDVFAIRHLAPGALYAYSAGFDEWSKVDVQHPADARQRYSRAFKYANRVYLAALLMKAPLALEASHPDEFHGFGIWELKAMPSDANAYFWEQVATSEYDDEYRKFFHSLPEFVIKFVDFQGFVCMTSASSSGREVRKFPPLVYSFASKSWFLLPECKSVLDYQCVFGF